MSGDKEYQMRKFGPILTDRPDGKKAYNEIMEGGNVPKILDFKDVFSLGSSFGDEIVPKLAKQNDNIISIRNANAAIKSCIKKIIEDTGIEVIYLN